MNNTERIFNEMGLNNRFGGPAIAAGLRPPKHSPTLEKLRKQARRARLESKRSFKNK